MEAVRSSLQVKAAASETLEELKVSDVENTQQDNNEGKFRLQFDDTNKPYMNSKGKISHRALINHLEQQFLQPDRPNIREGDYIIVSTKITVGEGKNKKEKIERIQGVCTKIKGHTVNKMLTIKKMIHGVGVTRIIPLHFPKITQIENQGQFKNWRKIFKNKKHPKNWR